MFVVICFIFDSWNNSRIARFFSPCASLVKVLDKVSASEHQAKLKKSKNKIVSREKMISMLFQQSREDFNCRYAIDEELKSLVVIADQLIETIDQAEFKSHVEHVAAAAKDFEV